MKQAIPIIRMVVLLLGLLMSIGCLGISVDDLKATYVPPAAAETLTSIAATQTAITPTAPPPQKVALVSFHGRYVVAAGAGDGWLLRQEPDLTDCGWFTLNYLDDGKVTLKTCHDRYATAPKAGTTRSDWRLWQEPDLDECGRFTLYDLGSDNVVIETCEGNVLTAGDGGWPEDLAWAVVGETDDLKDWERFTILRPFTLQQSMVVNFDNCSGVTRLGGQMGAAYDPVSDDRLVESYVEERERGCVARLEHDIVTWGAFWIQLQGADWSSYSQLVFDFKADPQTVPEQVKIELKRADGQQISILRYSLSEITTDWQTIAVNLSDFEGTLSSLTDIEELVFTFETDGSRKTGVIYLDNIALRQERDEQ
jgi:hypothetical protein